MGELVRFDTGDQLPEPRNQFEAEIVAVDIQLGLRATQADVEMARRLALIGRVLNASPNTPKSS